MSRDKSYIFDIYSACELIQDFVKGITFEQFIDDIMRQDAVIRRIEIIGEASNNLSEAFKEDHTEIPWSLIRGMRNRLVHDYGEIDLDLVWETIHRDIRQLKELLEPYR